MTPAATIRPLDAALSPHARPALRIDGAQSRYLDAVRGLAAQLVLLQHLVVACLPGSHWDQAGLGALGVLTFFLLSGFLITDSVAARLAARRFDAREFLVSRASRIYTPYLPAILLVAVLDWYASRSPAYPFAADFNLHTALGNVAMLQDFPLFQILRRLHVPDQPWFMKSFGSGRQFWTVSIEWWIYVAVGLGTALALRAPGRRGLLLPACLAFALVEPLYNLVGGPGDCLTLFWLLGGAAALLFRRVPGRCPVGPGCLLLAGLAALRLLYTRGVVYEPVFALLFGALLFLPLLAPGPSLLARLGLHRLSFPSYSLYLTHGSIVTLLVLLWPARFTGWPGLVALLLGTNLFAVAFAAAFEVPHRRVRRILLRWLGIPAEAAPTTAVTAAAR